MAKIDIKQEVKDSTSGKPKTKQETSPQTGTKVDDSPKDTDDKSQGIPGENPSTENPGIGNTTVSNPSEKAVTDENPESKAPDAVEEKPEKKAPGFFARMMGKMGYVSIKLVGEHINEIINKFGVDKVNEVLKNIGKASFEELNLEERFQILMLMVEDLKTSIANTPSQEQTSAETVAEAENAETSNQDHVLLSEVNEEDQKEEDSKKPKEDDGEESETLEEFSDSETTENDGAADETEKAEDDKVNVEDSQKAESTGEKTAAAAETITSETATSENKEIEELYNEVDKLTEEKKALQKQVEELNGLLSKLKRDWEKSSGEQNQKIQNAIREKNGLQTKLNTAKEERDGLQKELDELQEKFDILNASEVGTMTKTIEKLNGQIRELTNLKETAEGALAEAEEANSELDGKLKEANSKLEAANAEIKSKDVELDREKQTVADCNKTINLLNTEKENKEATINAQADDIKIKDEAIKEKDGRIGTLESEKTVLEGNVSALNREVEGLKKDKENLAKDVQSAESVVKAKKDFIDGERDAFATALMQVADALQKASSEKFLTSCEEEFDDTCGELQQKVTGSVDQLLRLLSAVDPAQSGSRAELEDKYHAIVKAQLDDVTGLTRIAQWYAYSCVPFMIDKSRYEGLAVNRGAIKKIYNLASELLAMVGIRYVIPALFVESLEDDSSFVNVTGQRQPNIEFMCPTARSHKSGIDRADSDMVIMDVVEVGYADSKGNNKTAQVII